MVRYSHNHLDATYTPGGEPVRKFLNPVRMVPHLWRHRYLIGQLTWREVIGRYKGSALGLGWSLLQPLMMLCVYTFVFSFVFNARWGNTAEEGRAVFGLTLFLGLIAYGIFSDVINSAPLIILGNVNYVKKVVFPLEILPLVRMLSCTIHAMFSMVVLFTGLYFVNGAIHWTAVFFPIMLLPLLLFTLGLGYFLSSLGVFIRDIGSTVGVFTTMILFLSPIFYPMRAVPERFRFIFQLNPMAVYIEDIREVVLWGKLPDMTLFCAGFLLAIVLGWGGFVWFMKTKKTFADVL